MVCGLNIFLILYLEVLVKIQNACVSEVLAVLDGKTIRKEIFVPDKIVNFVVG